MSDKEEVLNKAESDPKTVIRPLTTEVGQPRIVSTSRYIRDICEEELSMERRFSTYKNMLQDDAVANSVDFTNVQVVDALSRGVTRDKGSRRSRQAAEFIQTCFHNMSYGTWREFCADACTDLINGFSISNIVLEKAKYGDLKGALKLRKLSPRHPSSVYGWVWNKNNTELLGFVQDANIIKTKEPNPRRESFYGNLNLSQIGGGYYTNGRLRYPYISTEEMLLFRHNPSFGNPQGNSPLNSCFKAWKEKELVEHFEIVAVSKDFGGLLVVRVPSDFLNKASSGDYPDIEEELLRLQKDTSNLQKGATGQIFLASDADEKTNKYFYDLEIKGIEGGGKQYNTEDIINQKRKSIYNVFGTGFLLLGQNGHGSNALAGSQMSTFDHFVKRAIDWKVDVINNQLIPRLLAANDVYLSYKDMPYFEAADPSQPDLDTLSKVLQRSASVEGMTLSAFKDVYKRMGWDTEGLERLIEDRKEMKNTSRAGESQGTSGTGNTQDGGVASSTNVENKSLSSNFNFVLDYETDDEIVANNTITGDPIFIAKKG